MIYKIDDDGQNFEVVYDFQTVAGQDYYYTKLCEASNRKLYGTTRFGGNNESGTIYSFDINTNAFSVEIHLTDSTGNNSFGALLLADNGKFYGTTRYGGDFNDAFNYCM
ncbi:MAG: putative repeat protein (TIGR03803 family) [Limisphaerales bacterium]